MPFSSATDFLSPTCPDKDRSFLKYNQTLRFINDRQKVKIQKLEPSVAQLTPYEMRQTSEDRYNRLKVGGEINVVVPRTKKGVASYVSGGTSGTVRLLMKGSAIRIGYQIPDPILISIEGNSIKAITNADGSQRDPTKAWAEELSGGFFEQKKIADTEDCPIWGAKWSKIYEIAVPVGYILDMNKLQGSWLDGHST
jgi:hypothetical protein